MINLLSPYEVIFGVSYILVAASSVITLIEYNKKVNGIYAREDFLAYSILCLVAAFWPAIIFVGLVNKTLYVRQDNE
jgi:hypothetical protein